MEPGAPASVVQGCHDPFRGALVDLPLLQASDLKRHYRRGPQTVRALDGVGLELRDALPFLGRAGKLPVAQRNEQRDEHRASRQRRPAKERFVLHQVSYHVILIRPLSASRP